MKKSIIIIELIVIIACFVFAGLLVFNVINIIPENWYRIHALILLLLGTIASILIYRLIKSIHRYHIRSFSEIVDNVLSSGWSKQLSVLACVTILAFLISWLLVYSIDSIQWEDEKLNKHQSFWLTVCYFFDPGNLNLTNHLEFGPQSVISIIVAVLGMTILTGLFISTFTNIIEQRVTAVKSGLATYKHIKSHSVVIGFCELTESVILGILESCQSDRKIILLTNHDMESVRKSMYSLTNNKHYDGRIVIYSGDYRYEENLSRLNPNLAKSIFILGDDEIESRDFENIICAQRISKLFVETSTPKAITATPIPMYVRMDRMPSFSTLQRLNLQPDLFSDHVYFRPFNYFEHWTRLLWVKNKVEVFEDGKKKQINYPSLYFTFNSKTKEEEKFIHLIVSGFSQMGMALVLHALRAAHFSNFTEKNNQKTKITIVDPNIETLKPLFLSQYQHLEQIYDIELNYKNCKLEDIHSELIEWCTDQKQIITIAICLGDNDIALSQALNLPLEAYYQKGRNSFELPRILVKQRTLSGIWKMLEDREHEELTNKENNKKVYRKAKYNKYHNIYPFGMRVNGFYPDDLDDLKACLVHIDYEDKYLYTDKNEDERITIEKIYQLVENQNDKLIKDCVLQALVRWYNQPENIKWANRYQSDNHHVLKDVLHSFGINQLSDLHQQNQPLAICSDIEHRRWLGERVVSGWQQSPFICEGTPMRQDSLLLHYDIIKTSELGEDAKKDGNVVRNVLMLDRIYNYIKEKNIIQ